MALVHCWECEHLRSDASVACPHCGAPQRRPGGLSFLASRLPQAGTPAAMAAEEQEEAQRAGRRGRSVVLWVFYLGCIGVAALVVNQFVR